jgi:hypothetical protein
LCAVRSINLRSWARQHSCCCSSRGLTSISARWGKGYFCNAELIWLFCVESTHFIVHQEDPAAAASFIEKSTIDCLVRDLSNAGASLE